MNKDMGIGFTIGLLSGLLISSVVAGTFMLSKMSGAGIWDSALADIGLEEGPLMDTDIAIPETATLGEPFFIDLSFSNQNDVAATLDSVDIGEELLVGLKIQKVTPSPSTTYEMLAMKTYEFGIEYQPGETGLVRFTVMPLKEGTFSGDIDLCNPEQDYHSFRREVTVAKP